MTGFLASVAVIGIKLVARKKLGQDNGLPANTKLRPEHNVP
jgi:hypothetical protein